MDLLHGARRKQMSSKPRKLRSMPPVAFLQAAMLLLLPLAGAAAQQHSSVGALPNCAATCGDVPVPYPFGVGAGCYSSPGFNLTCDTTSDPPRLLLGPDAMFQVLNISVANATVRAARTGGVNFTFSSSSAADGRGAWRGLQQGDDARGPYALSDDGNELVLVRGCDVLAQLTARAGSNVTINGAGNSGNSTGGGAGGSGNVTICGCASFCPGTGAGRTSLSVSGGRCTGIGCCEMPISVGLASYDVQLRRLDPTQPLPPDNTWPPLVVIAEQGWLQQAAAGTRGAPLPVNLDETPVPVLLAWAIAAAPLGQDGTPPDSSACPADAARSKCKSSHSSCRNVTTATRGGYLCDCQDGYRGNPYLTDGCQDINECKKPEEHGCFGECTNLPGTFECRCPPGTQGDHTQLHGCVSVKSSSPGFSIGIGVGSGAGLMLLVLVGIFIARKHKQLKTKRLRQKFFRQNRGQLGDILDWQVIEEGGKQVEEVAALAATCVKLNSDERPTMRQVEMALESIQAKVCASDNVASEKIDENNVRRRFLTDPEGRSVKDMTRRYSLEEEFLMSARSVKPQEKDLQGSWQRQSLTEYNLKNQPARAGSYGYKEIPSSRAQGRLEGLPTLWDLSDCGHVLEPGVEGLADGVDDEADLPELLGVDDVAAIEDEGWLLHVVEELLVVQGLELVPLGQDAQTVGALGGLVRVPDAAHLLHRSGARRLQVHRVVPVELVHGQVPLDLVLRHLGVVDADLGLVTQETLADVDGRGLPGVTGVLLEGEAEDGDLLAGHGVEHGGHDAVDEAALLVVVDLDHLLPVVGHLGQAVALADVHQVQNVLLEAGATKANTGVQELGANPGVLAHGVSHFRHIGAGGLAECGDGVHRGDPLRQERICSKLGKLSRPQVGGEDPVLGNPVSIHILESLNGLPALRGLPATDEHSVRLEQVLNGCALSKELRVGEDLVVDALAVVGQDLLNGLCSLDRDSGFLNNDLVRLGDIGNHAGSTLPVGEVGSLASTKTTGLGGGVH
ncbi:hypothetical protein EJB05_04419, partial [Eragrostis curvula]